MLGKGMKRSHSVIEFEMMRLYHEFYRKACYGL